MVAIFQYSCNVYTFYGAYFLWRLIFYGVFGFYTNYFFLSYLFDKKKLEFEHLAFKSVLGGDFLYFPSSNLKGHSLRRVNTNVRLQIKQTICVTNKNFNASSVIM